jgi:hypothetical protein
MTPDLSTKISRGRDDHLGGASRSAVRHRSPDARSAMSNRAVVGGVVAAPAERDESADDKPEIVEPGTRMLLEEATRPSCSSASPERCRALTRALFDRLAAALPPSDRSGMVYDAVSRAIETGAKPGKLPSLL